MKRLDDRTMANLDVVLEEACKSLPNGGDHAFRKMVATKLLNAAKKGNTTLAGLAKVAKQTVAADRKNRST